MKMDSILNTDSETEECKTAGARLISAWQKLFFPCTQPVWISYDAGLRAALDVKFRISSSRKAARKVVTHPQIKKHKALSNTYFPNISLKDIGKWWRIAEELEVSDHDIIIEIF